jgi:DNA-binding GntR family transcriptional regulator
VTTVLASNTSAAALPAVPGDAALKGRARGVRTGAALAALLKALRADLAGGAYHPRERLVEADLVARYGTTRAAVRDALIQLTSEGIVERLPNRGARVRAMNINEAIEIAEVRRLLECLCARRAAERGTDEEIRTFEAIATSLHRAAVAGTVSEYLTYNALFHKAIAEMARHETAQAILDQFQHRPIDRFFPQEFRTSPPAASVHEHEQIARAIAARDGDAAEKAMYEHLANLVATLKRFEPVPVIAGGGE